MTQTARTIRAAVTDDTDRGYGRYGPRVWTSSISIRLDMIIVTNTVYHCVAGADPRFRRGGFVQEFRLGNRSYPDVHDFSLCMRVIIANANNIADSLGGGGGSKHPKKKPVSAPVWYW